MKKLIFTSLAMIGFSAMAQTQKSILPVPETDKQVGVCNESSIKRTKNQQMGKAGSSGWLSLTERLEANGSQLVAFPSGVPNPKSYARNQALIFPDSTVFTYYEDDNNVIRRGNASYYLNGYVFDGRSTLFTPLSPALSNLGNYSPYSLDSINIVYAYHRSNPNPNIVDTLEFEIFYANQGTRDTIHNSPFGATGLASNPDRNMLSLAYNFSTNRGAGVQGRGNVMRFKVPLTTDDETPRNRTAGTFSWGGKTIAINPMLNLNARVRFSVAYKFVPGYAYMAGDTLDADSVIMDNVSRKLNSFRMSMIEDYSNLSESDAETWPEVDRLIMNPMLVTKDIRYNKSAQGWNGQFYPGAFTRSNPSYSFTLMPELDVHVTNALKIGVNEVRNDQFAMGNVYPNPTQMGTNSILAFSLKQAATVEVKIFNIAGQMVKSVMSKNLTAGEHAEVLDIAGLRAGIYMVNMTVNGVNQTKKLTIVE